MGSAQLEGDEREGEQNGQAGGQHRRAPEGHGGAGRGRARPPEAPRPPVQRQRQRGRPSAQPVGEQDLGGGRAAAAGVLQEAGGEAPEADVPLGLHLRRRRRVAGPGGLHHPGAHQGRLRRRSGAAPPAAVPQPDALLGGAPVSRRTVGIRYAAGVAQVHVNGGAAAVRPGPAIVVRFETEAAVRRVPGGQLGGADAPGGDSRRGGTGAAVRGAGDLDRADGAITAAGGPRGAGRAVRDADGERARAAPGAAARRGARGGPGAGGAVACGAGWDPRVAGADGARDGAVAGGAQPGAEGPGGGGAGWERQRCAAADAAVCGARQGGRGGGGAPGWAQLRVAVREGDELPRSVRRPPPAAGDDGGRRRGGHRQWNSSKLLRVGRPIGSFCIHGFWCIRRRILHYITNYIVLVRK